MSTLQIRKLESGAWKHVDSIDGDFFLGRFNFKQEFNKAFIVEAYGAKRREYSISDITVYNYLGTAEMFTNWTDLFNRLTELGYTGIDTNGMIPAVVVDWGDIGGDITDQTDLQTALGYKQDLLTETNFGAFANTLSIKLTPSADDEIVTLDSITGEAVTIKYSSFGGGGSDTILNYHSSGNITVTTSEQVSGQNASSLINPNENVTKSGSLLTGPYYMNAQAITKTAPIKRLTFRYLPDGSGGNFIIKMYAFNQNNGSISIFNCRLLFNYTFTTTPSAYYMQVRNLVTADFIDANLNDGEYLAITIQQSGGTGVSIRCANLTIVY